MLETAEDILLFKPEYCFKDNSDSLYYNNYYKILFASLVILIGYNSVGLTKQIWEQCDNEGESISQTSVRVY